MNRQSPNRKPGRVFRIAGIFLAAFIGFALLASAADSSRKQKWLRFFFDGVPDPNAKTNQPAIPHDENGRPLETESAPQTNAATAKAPVFYRHPPYENHECGECHKSKYSPELKAPEKELCFACHDDFLEKAKSKHQPAENGECSSCHDPHGSPLPKMVKATDSALCAECHDDFSKKFQHTPVQNGECLSCHNPHASAHEKLTLKPDGKLCFECHDDFEQKLQKAAFKHDPAGNGECASCHDPHHSNESGLLIKPGGQLCFECHEEKDVASAKGHAGADLKSCVSCHDPHFGGDEFLLKPAALKTAQPAPPK